MFSILVKQAYVLLCIRVVNIYARDPNAPCVFSCMSQRDVRCDLYVNRLMFQARDYAIKFFPPFLCLIGCVSHSMGAITQTFRIVHVIEGFKLRT